MALDVKAFDFNIGKNGYFKALLNTKGLETMAVKADVKAAINLAEPDATLGLPDLDMKGMLRTDIVERYL
jgi:AsmA protein